MLLSSASSAPRLPLRPLLSRGSTRRALSSAFQSAAASSASSSSSSPSGSGSGSAQAVPPSPPQQPPAPLPSSQPRRLTHAERDAALRASLLERDGGPASVPTRGGSWDSELGPNTSRSLFRVLDQTRSGKGAEASKERRYGKSAVDGWKMPGAQQRQGEQQRQRQGEDKEKGSG